MRPLARLFLGLLVVSGWLLLALGAIAWIAEETGLLARLVRGAIAAEAGTLGDDLRLEGVRLRWFEHAIEIDRLDVGPDGELARLDGLRLELADPRAPGGAVRRIDVRGGHVRLSPALTNSLQRYSEEVAGSGALQPGAAPLPTIQVEGLRIDLVTRRWGIAPLGRLDLLARTNARGVPEVFGRLVPSLTSRRGEPGEVFLSGAVGDGGALVLHANATRLPLGTDGLPADEELEPLRALDPRGILELEASAWLPLDGGAPRGSLRLAVQRGGFTLQSGRHRADGLHVDVEAAWTPEALAGWRDPRSWHGVLRASGSWNGTEVDATALLGREAEGSVFEAWAHLAALPLERSLLAALDAGPIAERAWDGLDPSGTCEVWLGARVPAGAHAAGADVTGAAEQLELCALARPSGTMRIVYQGMLRDARGRFTEGFPLPLDGVTGEVAFALGPGRAHPWRIALLELAGSAGPTVIRARGVVQAPRASAGPDLPSHDLAELDLDLDGERLTWGEPLRAALEGLSGPLPPESTWLPFQPAAGELGVKLRLFREPEQAWLATDLDLELRGMSVAWKDLPVPLDGADGRLLFRSDGLSERALSVSVTGALRTALDARLGLRLRTARPPSGARDEAVAWDLSWIRVAVERLALMGDDRRILAERFPDIGSALDELAPRGFAQLEWERVGWSPRGPLESRAEVVPVAPAQLVPRRFPLTAADVHGRVLHSGVDTGADVQGDVRLTPLVGTLGDGTLIALEALLPRGTIVVRGAGVDPSSRSLLGALGGLLAPGPEGRPAFDSSALAITGRLDVEGRIPLTGGSAAGEGRWRFFLRDGQLATPTGFRLDRLRGELGLEAGVLRGSRIAAQLAQTPVELDDVRFAADGAGWRLEARFDAREVPIERATLAGFVDAATLEALLGELAWQGRFDFERGHLVIALPAEGAARIELDGDVVPHAMSIRLGLPLTVDEARARLERLVYEGGRVRALVSIEGLRGDLAGRRLEDAHLLVTYVEPALTVESLDGTFEGGRIASLGAGAERAGTAFTIALAEPFPFQVALDLRGVELGGLLRGLFSSGIATRGELDGELRLAGDLEHLLGIRGSGTLRVRDSRLWSVPVFRALFGQLGLDDTATFDSMYANVEIEEGRVAMRDILIRSPLLQLVGTGGLDFDGRLHHDLEVRYELVDRLGPLTRLIYWIQNGLLSVEIRGDMQRPVVVLQNPLRRLFGGSPDYRDLPAPGYAPLPDRF